jgi:hypothetical protein
MSYAALFTAFVPPLLEHLSPIFLMTSSSYSQPTSPGSMSVNACLQQQLKVSKGSVYCCVDLGMKLAKGQANRTFGGLALRTASGPGFLRSQASF